MNQTRHAAPKTGPNWPADPVAGACIHFTSLPSSHGIGDIGDAAQKFVDQLAEMGLRIWQFLPIGPSGYGDSPYQALSAFAGNEMLVGLEPLVRQGLLEASELRPLKALPAHAVEYETLIPLKRDLLMLAASRFKSTVSAATKSSYLQFCGRPESGWLHDYALFRVIKAKHNEKPWTQWQDELARRDKSAIAACESSCQAELEQIKIIQFFFHCQWQALRNHAKKRGIKLFGDLPFYIALDSADAWSERDLLKIDACGRPSHVAGVPPDYFSEDGQLWGNPLYDWKSLKKSGYRWWIQRLQQAAACYDLARIDHFRGFESYWSIPQAETTARKGKWLRGPGDDLLEALRKASQDLAIVAEDLGMITDSVVALRQRHGLPGMRVLQFDLLDPEFDPDDIPENCVCYTGTHDNDTTAGWLSGRARGRIARKEARKLRRAVLHLTRGTVETLHTDLLRLAFSTRARVVIAPMQDFLGLGSEARLNHPGTTHGNWRWRMLPDQPSPQARKQIAGIVEACSRNPR